MVSLLYTGGVVDPFGGPRTLHQAAKDRKLREFVRYGALQSLDEVDAWGCTALHDMAYLGYMEEFEYLLELGANPRIPDTDGRTPLHSASRNGHADIVKKLIEIGMNPEEEDHNGTTAIQVAKNDEVLEQLTSCILVKCAAKA